MSWGNFDEDKKKSYISYDCLEDKKNCSVKRDRTEQTF